MPATESILRPEKLSTLDVTFACRTSVIMPSRDVFDRIAAVLREAWQEHFERPMEPGTVIADPPGVIFAMQRRYFLREGFADAPTVLIRPDVLEVHLFRKLNGEVLREAEGDLWVDEPATLHRIRQAFLGLQRVLTDQNYRFHRTSQTFRMDYGLYTQDENLQIERMLRGNADASTHEVKMVATRVRQQAEREYNYRCDVAFARAPTGDGVLSLKVDINNRQMRDSLDPHDLETIWAYGRAHREEAMNEVFSSGQEGEHDR
jgi:hypothetical protein